MFRRILQCLLVLLSFAIPFEHKYDKLFRYYSKTLIPEGMALPHFFDPKIYFYASDLIALFLSLSALIYFRVPLRQFFSSRSSLYLWLLFILAFFSILPSPMAHYPIPYIRLLQLLTPFLLYSFIINMYQDPKEKRSLTYAIFWAIAIAGCCQATIGILQYIHESPLGLRLIGEANHLASFPSCGARKWLLDPLFPYLGSTSTIYRVSGTLSHPNVCGGILCISLLSSYALLFHYPSFRAWIACTIPIQFLAMSLTYSRSAFFSWFFATIFWFGYILYRNYKSSMKDTCLQILGAAVLFSVLFSGIVLYEPLKARGGFFNYEETPSAYSDLARIRYQDLSLRMIQYSPWQGTGFNQLSVKALEMADPNDVSDAWIGPHNIYIYLATEIGLPALALFLCFIATLLWAALKAESTLYIGSLVAILLALLLIGCCDFYPLLFQQGKLLFFINAALLAAHSCYVPLSQRKNVPAA